MILNSSFKSFLKESQLFRTSIGVGISIFLLILLFNKSQLEIKTALDSITSSFKIFLLLSAMLLFVLMTWLHSLRTKVIYYDSKKSIANIKALDSLLLGNFYNCTLPGNVGEGVRAWHFSRKNNIPLNNTISIFFVEKSLDALMVGGLLLLPVIFNKFSFHVVQFSFLMTAFAVSIFSICFFLVLTKKKLVKKALGFAPNKKLRFFLFKLYINFKCHIERMIETRSIYLFVVISYSMFLINIMQFQLVLWCVDLPNSMQSFFSAFVLSLTMIIVMFIPSAPGNLGIAHYGLFISLEYIAEVQEISLSKENLQQMALATIFMHLSYFLPEVLLGVFVLLKERKKLFG